MPRDVGKPVTRVELSDRPLPGEVHLDRVSQDGRIVAGADTQLRRPHLPTRGALWLRALHLTQQHPVRLHGGQVSLVPRHAPPRVRPRTLLVLTPEQHVEDAVVRREVRRPPRDQKREVGRAPTWRVARDWPVASSARSGGQLCPWNLHPDGPARATELLHPLVQAGVAAVTRIIYGSGER